MYRTFKTKYRYPLNLQFFAEEQPEEQPEERPFEIVDDEIDMTPQVELTEDGDIELNIEEDAEDEAKPEEGETAADGDDLQRQEEVEDTKPEPNAAAKAAMAERRKFQERLKAYEKKAAIAEKIMRAAGFDDPDKFQQQLDALEAQRLEQQGYDPQVAAEIVTQRREIEEMKRTLTRQKFDVEAAKLKEDPFFADLDDWRDEVEDLALRTNQSLEQAYMALRGKERMAEYRRELEQRMQVSQAKKASARINTTGGGGTVPKTEKLNLTTEQMTFAKHLVKTGVIKSVAEYAKFAKK